MLMACASAETSNKTMFSIIVAVLFVIKMETAFTKSFDRISLESNFLKQPWAPFFTLWGAILVLLGVI